MKITQVRNATLLIHYAGTRFLIDPMLAPSGSYPWLRKAWPTAIFATPGRAAAAHGDPAGGGCG